MKRYTATVEVKETDEKYNIRMRYEEATEGEMIKYSDHIAELAKKDEVIAVAKEALEEANALLDPTVFDSEAIDRLSFIVADALAKMKEMEK